MIDKYNLFDWIFKGLKVDKRFIEDNDPIIVLATLLKHNSIEELGKQLNALKYSIEELKGVTFLVGLFKLSPETAVTLKKAQKHCGLSPEQIKKFSQIEGINQKLIDAFLKFNLSVSGPEAMELTGLKPGPELGKAIQDIETDNFKNLLK